MLDSVKKVIDGVTVVLVKIEHDLTLLKPEEIKLLSDVLVCLWYFPTATKALNGETYISISMVIPTNVSTLLTDLQEPIQCKDEATVPLETQLGKHFAIKLQELSKKYLLIYKSRSITV